ncbi:hypothetical protein F5883DRAFT_31380 [Diaporthe sp. PMI_573]|nr:hypothetical protein F5883DRAFT_31380 [Diaporthaceae sp. PMI_573]
MRRRIHASAAAPPRRTRATAAKQHPSREPQTSAQPRQRHTRSAVQDELLEAHDDPDKILRRPQRKRVSVPNVSDNNVSDNNVSDNNNISEKNDGLVLEAVGADAPRLRTSSERSISYQAVYSEDGTGSVEEDLLASWYRNVEYLIRYAPLDPPFESLELSHARPIRHRVVNALKYTRAMMHFIIAVRAVHFAVEMQTSRTGHRSGAPELDIKPI